MHDKLLKLKLMRGAADDKVVKAEIKAKTLAKAANKTGASKRDVMRATDAKVKAENAAQKAQAIHDYDWDPVANPYHYLMEPRVAGAGDRCFACDGQKEEKRGTPCAKRTIEERLAGDMRCAPPRNESNRCLADDVSAPSETHLRGQPPCRALAASSSPTGSSSPTARPCS